MSPEEFDACFGRFKYSVFRLETLPAYSAPSEAERIEAFRRGAARPERSVRTSPWLARIAVTTVTEGKRWDRVRILDDPLTEYQRYQLDSYVESQAAGERVRVMQRGPAALMRDFWLFDCASVMWMSYDRNGQFLGSALTEDASDVAWCLAARDTALDNSVPLNAYLAARRQASRAA